MEFSLVQSQQLTLSTRLYQSLKLMEVPLSDLREQIEQELEKNPALEVAEKIPTYSYVHNVAHAEDKYQRFLEAIPARGETLQEHLLKELHMQWLDVPLRTVAELVIQNLDSDGFHCEAPELLVPDSQQHLLKEALTVVQSLEPVGCATADYKESLQVQLQLLMGTGQHGKKSEKVLQHLALLEREKYAAVAKKTGCTVEEVRSIRKQLSALSPFPGRMFSHNETQYLVPDVQVVQKDGSLVVIINDEELPVLQVNSFLADLAAKKGTARSFAKNYIREARWFIGALNRRNTTLMRISQSIVQFQQEFFLKGPKYLVPLTLKDVAQAVQLHEATVSRAVNGKYVQSAWGMFELRHFFSSAVGNSLPNGLRYSKESVKEIIKELIAGEEQRCSDQALVAQLEKRGISIARRTVTKYRNELAVGSSYHR
ncbi:MAG: RNA polymerase factor sigma-54 [Treponema sp.]|jgi:RNA polymerase sigma-54 factor|nr:RNA polymerase factor sigma-54 [Treponema sp.]